VEDLTGHAAARADNRPDNEATREVERRGGVKARWWRLPKRARVAAAGYAVVVVFGIGTGVTRVVGASVSSALVVGALAAAPLVVALIGDRITGIKAFSVEITLSEVTVPIAGDFSGTVMTSAEMGGSAAPDLLASIGPLMRDRSKLLRINLREDNYWWSTRIFLVAALAEDYTEVEALIFVRAGMERIFVGIASPRAIRARLAVRFPDYEVAYRKVRSESAASVINYSTEVDEILTWRWQNAYTPTESAVKQIVSSNDLQDWLGIDLDTEALPYGPLTPLLRYRINSRDRHYAALTDHSRLVAVVDRNELAVRSTAADLERFSGGS
jgi:hypothetical protein